MADIGTPAPSAPVATTVNGMVVNAPEPTPIISSKTAAVPAAEVKPEKPAAKKGPIPFEQFDYKAHLRSLLPGPAETKTEPTPEAAAAPAAADGKAPEPAAKAAESPDDVLTRRLDALSSRERAANEIERRVAADLDRLKAFEDTRGAFAKDPIGTLSKAGVPAEEIARIVVKAIEDLGGGEAAKPEEPAAPKTEDAAPTPEQLATAKADYASRAAPVAAKRAGELAADADLVRAAAGEGMRHKGKDIYGAIVAECDARFEAGKKDGTYDKALSNEQAFALLDTVTREINAELAKDEAFVARHRKTAPAEAKAAEKSEIAAITTKMGGTVPTQKVFKSEAEWREAHQAHIASLPRAQRVGRFSP